LLALSNGGIPMRDSEPKIPAPQFFDVAELIFKLRDGR
jgi:hypothetical protein